MDSGGGVAGAAVERGHQVRMRSLLSALSGLAAEQWAPARVQQLLRLSVEVLDAEHAVLAVDGEHDQPGPVLFSTAAEDAVEELRDLLGSHLDTAETSPTPPYQPVTVPVVDAGPDRARPVLQVSLTTLTGGSGRLYVVGQAGRPPFTAADEELLAEFAKMAALTVENALHDQQSRQQVKWLRGLTLITQSLLQAGADEMAVWQEIADRVHQLARARTVTISVVSEDDPDLLEVRVAAGVGADQLRGTVYRAVGSLPAQAMAAGSWLAGRSDRDWTSHQRTGPSVGATLAIPLIDGNGARGAIVLSRHQGQAPFNRVDVAMAHDFANQAMLAVELAETRAAEQSLSARTAVEAVGGTFQDRTIQRLFAASLAVEAAVARHPEPWLTLLHADLAAVIDDARSSLNDDYGRTS